MSENKPAENSDTTAKKVIGRPFPKGVSGNPGGIPKNPLKEFQRKQFESMSDEEKEKFLKEIDKYKRWTMTEGNPDNKTEHAVDERLEDIILKINKVLDE